MSQTGSKDKLTNHMDRIGNVRVSHSKVDQATNKFSIHNGTIKRNPISRRKLNIKLNRSANNLITNKLGTANDLIRIFG